MTPTTYLFRDRDHFWNVLDGSVGQQVKDLSNKVGLVGLCFLDAGARSFYTKEKPILEPDDLKGMKIRVQANETSLAMVEALGGSPTPIPWGELYTALQQGVVDGAENNKPSYLSSRHYEVCNIYSLDEHTRIPDMLLMSLKKWNDYPEDIRDLITMASDATSMYQRELWQTMADQALDTLKAEGVKVYYPDKSPFMLKVESMYIHYQGTAIGDLVSDIIEYQEVEI